MRNLFIIMLLALSAVSVGCWDSNDNEPTPTASWSAAECEEARQEVAWPTDLGGRNLRTTCMKHGGEACTAMVELQIAINENCPP